MLEKIVKSRKTQFQLILISCLFSFSLTAQSQESSKEALLAAFYASEDYLVYLEQKPITRQVMVTMEIIELGEEINFPNPYVARLFHMYLSGSTNFSSKVVINQIISLTP